MDKIYRVILDTEYGKRQKVSVIEFTIVSMTNKNLILNRGELKKYLNLNDKDIIMCKIFNKCFLSLEIWVEENRISEAIDELRKESVDLVTSSLRILGCMLESSKYDYTRENFNVIDINSLK